MDKIIFIGTNNFASDVLENLLKKKLKINYVITKIDSKKGRGQKLTPSQVKQTAINFKLPYITTENINLLKYNTIIKDISPDLIILVDYGEKISNKIINIPKYGIINIHPSILPKLRGPTPIQTAILNGEKETGVSIIKINNKIDSGNILNIIKYSIKKNETYLSLSKKLSTLASICTIKTIKDIIKNKIKEIKQNEKNATYTQKIENNFYKLDFKNNSINIERKIRALTGIKYPYIFFKKNLIKIIKVKLLKKNKNANPGIIINVTKNGVDVKTNNGIIRIKKIQINGQNIKEVKNIIFSNKDFFKIGDKID